MSSFIEKCNCRGFAPPGLKSIRHNLRPHVIGEMLQDRTSPRVLVAPKGYGKTSVAFEYAQLIFEFQNVFWIPGDSPCFIRDLDKGNFAELIFAHNPSTSLIICDELPYLDKKRQQLFKKFISEIAKHNCEVLVTCAPTSAHAACDFENVTLIRPYQLVLSDDEIEVERSRGNIKIVNKVAPRLHMRAPAQIWLDNGDEEMLCGLCDPLLSKDCRKVAFVLLLLKVGMIDEITNYIKDIPLEALTFLEDYYPFLGIDTSKGTFDTFAISCKTLAKVTKFTLQDLTSPDDKNSIDTALRIAKRLYNARDYGFLCEFVKEFFNQKQQQAWLLQSGWNLIFEGQMAEVLDIARKLSYLKAESHLEVEAIIYWAQYLLNNCTINDKLQKKITKESPSQKLHYILKLILLPLEDNPDLTMFVKNALSCNIDSNLTSENPSVDWIYFIELYNRILTDALSSKPISTVRNSCTAISKKLKDAKEQKIASRKNATFLAAYFALRLFNPEFKRLITDLRKESSQEYEKACGSYIHLAETVINLINENSDETEARNHIPNVIFNLCLKEVHSVVEFAPYLLECDISPAAKARNLKFKESLNVQLADSLKLEFKQQEAKNQRFSTLVDSPNYDDAYRAVNPSQNTAVPLLEIKMFGGFDAYIGDRQANTRILTRKKVKTTLVILMLSKGREVSKELITKALWPTADESTRTKNFYVIWSELRKALTVDSICPYLVRSQTGYRLDKRFVKSDLEDFDNLCNSMLFGDVHSSAWRDIYDKAVGAYAEDLLPGLQSNDYVNSMRVRYKSQMVDGLVASAFRLLDGGEPRGAIWFSREAIRREPTREDAYIAMMLSQIASDQRGAALETYFECRRNLREYLGIDPSQKVMDIYRSIIEVEEMF